MSIKLTALEKEIVGLLAQGDTLQLHVASCIIELKLTPITPKLHRMEATQ